MSQIKQRTGLAKYSIAIFLQTGLERQLLRYDDKDDQHVMPTELGMRYLDDLLLLID